MKEKISASYMTPHQSMIAAAVFVGVFVLWFFWAALDIPSPFALLAHRDAAPWVQAIGSLIMVGIAVFTFYAGESRREVERQEEKKLDLDEAKFFLLRNGKSFTGIYSYAFTNQMIYYDPNHRGKGNTLFYYPAVNLFSKIYPQIENLYGEFNEFMQMQVPMGVPRACIEHIDKHQRLVSQLFSIINSNRLHIERIKEICERPGKIIQYHEIEIFEEMDRDLEIYIPHLKRLNLELVDAQNSLLKLFRD